MKDEEKAKKIADSVFSSGFNTNRTFYDMAVNTAVAMAEWKDKQMIEKACEWLEDMACYYAHWEYDGDTYEREILFNTKEFIEDFKKAMKGCNE